MAGLLVAACAGDPVPEADSTSDTPDTAQWISMYDPQHAWNGYTLGFFAHRIPILVDMNGHIVHRWPAARVKSRLRLLPDGSLLGIALGRGVVEYDWQGEKTWEFVSDIGFAHHDVIRLENGNTVTLIRPDEGRFDVVLEVDRAGKVVWRWDAEDHLRRFVPPEGWGKVDVTHLNSIQALPENRWFDAGDTRFRPGNYLMSSRELNMVFLVDRATSEVVWSFAAGLDKQHEPLMTGPAHPRAGNILIFDNRYGSFYKDRQSRILEVDPTRNQIVWQFRTAGFYSPTSGVQQPLPNGNVLVTSSRGGRTFEIDRYGRIVWEWTPPFDTTRMQRYAFDYTPQLAALPRSDVEPVRPGTGHRHVDTDVYRFARRGLRRTVRVAGKKREVLKHNNDCRRMVLPAGSTLDVDFGIDPAKLSSAEGAELSVRFSLLLRPLGTQQPIELINEIVDPESATWQHRSIDVSDYALRPAEICLETEWQGRPEAETSGFAFWQQPQLRRTVTGTALLTEDDLALDPMTDEELETRRKHLEALGYID